MRYYFFSLIFFLAACGNSVTMPQASIPIAVEAVPTISPDNSQLAAAQRNYNTLCAHCHGYGGDGQPLETAERTETLGYHTVPLHNSAGHTWQHPDQLLFETIKYGVESPINLYTMTPFGDLLSDDEIFAIIDYLRLWWTDDQQTWQEQLTTQFAENNPYWSESPVDEE
ncbi:MAG: cytochrome c [Anaerolineae bacterium]|nr:cytochrome c [Anaerolineae bacterium]